MHSIFGEGWYRPCTTPEQSFVDNDTSNVKNLVILLVPSNDINYFKKVSQIRVNKNEFRDIRIGFMYGTVDGFIRFPSN